MLDANVLFNSILANGGATVSLEGFEPSEGFAVSIYPYRGICKPLHMVDAHVISSWISRNLEWLSRADHYVGAWLDHGFLYLDISIIVSDRDEAIALGRAHDQLSIFDFSTFESIDC